MSANPVISKIVGLLRSDATDRQTAAAIILGELRVKDAGAVRALLSLLDQELPSLQRHALEALTAIGTPRIVPRAFELLATRDEDLRRAAIAAVAGLGEQALPAIRGRLPAATPQEKRALEEILGRLGGQDALATLLPSLAPNDIEAARAAASALRPGIKDADARERRRYLQQATGYLASKKAVVSPAARVAALKVLGFLDDDSAVPTLLKHATSSRQGDAEKQEAVISLRAYVAGKAGRKIVDKLVGIAETSTLAVARVALYSLAGAKIPAAAAQRLGNLAAHVEPERGLLAIDIIGQVPGSESSDALARVLTSTQDRARAEAAANALGRRPEAANALLRALLSTHDRDRAQMLASLLRPRLAAVGANLRRQALDTALARLEAHDPTWETLLGIARAADPTGTTQRLRALGDKLRRAKKPEHALAVLRVLGRSAEAAPQDGYALASLELTHGLRDQALAIIGQLLDRGFDVAAAIGADRALGPAQRYQVGFHFAEQGHPLGEEVLTAVVKSAGRTKVGQMARAKLKSSGF